ncbi:ArnT family glycosyltransferase [Pseudomonas citronellolis]|uniref:ArnT family glycosyltransferase n=1 Tax=Pseudomonas citronellolis TaxID=53408 RepID=UPI0023E3EEDE|nr:glycosyltransferase family 39 protein [Pseudomonas citronellolis]MDF3932834.1 glycosyltransferase family 39 protein [Pseudomonas citronellolis]
MKYLRSERGQLLLLLGVTALILLFGLGLREVWGPEVRWADISLRMLQSGDYLDPYLLSEPYYDKPLLSYWLITAPAHLFGLNHWTLRLSTVLAGWGSVWLTYLLGTRLFERRVGLVAGWLLATTFYFAFWARVATADILTVFGVLAALYWYWRGPDDTRFSRYLGFCLILSVTSLCKGLIGFVLPVLVLLPHLFSEGRFKRHLNLRLLAAAAVAGALYLVPFILSKRYGAPTYAESGLDLVVRENLVRFFQPFDHEGPIYTYLIYLPVYTLPWAPLWIAGLWLAVRQWKTLEPNERWLVWALAILFLFFSASGSRRSYYVLPLVPFAQLLAGWWLVRRRQGLSRAWRRGIAGAALVLLLVLGVAYPWSNLGGGSMTFARDVQAQAEREAPWQAWRVVLVGDIDRKLPMYLNRPGQPQAQPFFFVPEGADYPRDGDSAAFFAWLQRYSGQAWDPARSIVIVDFRHHQAPPLAYLGGDHQALVARSDNGQRLFKQHGERSLAYLPATASAAQSSAQALEEVAQ